MAMLALRNRRARRLLLAATLTVAALTLALALAGRLLSRSSAPAPAATVVEGSATVGRLAPRVELPDLNAIGRRVRLADFRGRPTVVNFWASWCPFCVAEMPAFERVHRQHGTQAPRTRAQESESMVWQRPTSGCGRGRGVDGGSAWGEAGLSC
jgi:thiol-disulfide isomerase/thioredoxin